MRTYQNFKAGEQGLVEPRCVDAEALAQLCFNKLIVSSLPKPEIATLLSEAFNITTRDEAREVMDTLMRVKMRLGQITLKRDTGAKPPNTLDYAAYVILPAVSESNNLYIRDDFFKEKTLDQTTKLIHECVHLRYPNNPDGGHPGGAVMAFNGQHFRIPFKTKDAIRNPYCYEYFAQMVSLLPK